MRVLLPDTWHFHRRNFRVLLDALAMARIPSVTERSRWRWWKRHGDYRPFAPALHRHLSALGGIEDCERATHLGVPLLSVVRSEFLCLVLPRLHWRTGAGPNDARHVLARALADPEDRRDLQLCLAAACDWVEFWNAFLDRHSTITILLAFSGSYIYTRALNEVGRQRGLRCFVCETFFTGNEFYFEERSTPLPNRSRLGDPEWLRRLTVPEDPNLRDALRVSAHLRLAAMRNKNVRVKDRRMPWSLGRRRPTVLIIGQVLNDFSIIETDLSEASSVSIYRHLIDRLLADTEFDIVFKAHPWERHRPNLCGPVTFRDLETYLGTLPDARRGRARLVEELPLRQLFHQVDWAIALSSQGLLEACQAGMKPVQIGKAFFSGQGFTHDFSGPDTFVESLATGRLEPSLSLPEYRCFEDFLVKALVIDLVTNRPGGEESILARIREPGHVPTAPQIDVLDLSSGGPGLFDWVYELAGNPVPWMRDAADRLALGWSSHVARRTADS